jgi:hypothetical protein
LKPSKAYTNYSRKSLTPENRPPAPVLERILRGETNIAGFGGIEAKPSASPSVLSKMLRRPSQVLFREGSLPPAPTGVITGVAQQISGVAQQVRKPSIVLSKERLQEHLRFRPCL